MLRRLLVATLSGVLACSGGGSGPAPDRCAGVVCTALDACRLAGACDPSTGQCSSSAAPDGAACPAPNAIAACQAGACAVVACDAGFADCGVAPGCETPLGTLSDCAACGNACTAPDGAVASCTGGTCGYSWPECAPSPPSYAPSVRCTWSEPAAGDPFPAHASVLATPMVVDLDLDRDFATRRPSIVFPAYDALDGGSAASVGTSTQYGVVRVIDGETCADQHVLPEHVVASAPVALGDLDGDGLPEIIAKRVGGGLAAWRFDPGAGAFARLWSTASTVAAVVPLWVGPALRDLDGDGRPEVLLGGSVFDGLDGTSIDETLGIGGSLIVPAPVVADLDGDGATDLVLAGSVYRWDAAGRRWALRFGALPVGAAAVADFGTFGADPGLDDRTARDAVGEIAIAAGGQVGIYTSGGRLAAGPVSLPGSGGGPPGIGDLDGDGRAEVAVAFQNGVAAVDPDCVGTPPPVGCAADGLRWSAMVEDASSSETGLVLFDFDGDGRAEVVHADECFARILDGATGATLMAIERTSCTFAESPIVADVDGGRRAALVVPSNPNCGIAASCASPHSGVARRGISVLADPAWRAARPIWHQQTFANGEVTDAGGVRRDPVPDFAPGGPNGYRESVFCGP